jgi:hypothetical protein
MRKKVNQVSTYSNEKIVNVNGYLVRSKGFTDRKWVTVGKNFQGPGSIEELDVSYRASLCVNYRKKIELVKKPKD